MDIEILKNTLQERIGSYVVYNYSKFCFEVDGFLIPKRLITKNKKKINIELNRLILQKQGNSPYSINMNNYLTDKGIYFIKEFIILIKNYTLWKKILEEFKLPKNKFEEYLSKNYFSLDYFLPNNLTCIEIDSDYHKNKKIFDKARDMYLRLEHSIETIRLYHFDSNSLTSDKDKISLLDYRVFNINVNKDHYQFDYRNNIIESLIYENEYTLTMICRYFENIISLEDFINQSYKYYNYTITEKDYNDLAQGLDFKTRPILFSEDFINLSWELLGMKITILKNVINYTIKDINVIMDSINDLRRLSILCNGIPYWISYITEIPNNLTRYLKPETPEDKFISAYIKNLRLRNP